MNKQQPKKGIVTLFAKKSLDFDQPKVVSALTAEINTRNSANIGSRKKSIKIYFIYYFRHFFIK
jgi:hypothetical protein